MKLEKTFNDLSYVDRRKKYRNYTMKNEFAKKLKLLVIDEVSKELPREILKGVDLKDFLNIVLVDGYITFERIYNKKMTNVIGYKNLDPNSLVISIVENKHGEIIWIQNDDNESMRRLLTDTQILLYKYPIKESNDSLIGQLYTKQINLDDNDMIKEIIENVKESIKELMNKELLIKEKI
jgi:hypothetical protein